MASCLVKPYVYCAASFRSLKKLKCWISFKYERRLRSSTSLICVLCTKLAINLCDTLWKEVFANCVNFAISEWRHSPYSEWRWVSKQFLKTNSLNCHSRSYRTDKETITILDTAELTLGCIHANSHIHLGSRGAGLHLTDSPRLAIQDEIFLVVVTHVTSHDVTEVRHLGSAILDFTVFP